MIRTLRISKGGLELARGQLYRAQTWIGRAPTCEIVLRAPGVKPFHFVVEWAGSGEFDPTRGHWTLLDISHAQEIEAAAGEGVVLGSEAVKIGDYQFHLIEDRLESSESIGGQITRSLQAGGSSEVSGLVELVQLRSDFGAVEQVLHLPIRGRGRRERPLDEFREFQIHWAGSGSERVVEVLLEEMSGAQVSMRGKRWDPEKTPRLMPGDVLHVTWKGREFYLRFVDRAVLPKIPRVFIGEPDLWKAIGITCVIALLLSLWTWWSGSHPKLEELPAPRMARIEIRETAPPPPPEVPAPPAPAESLRVEANPPKEAKSKAVTPIPVAKTQKAAQAAAPRQKAPEGDQTGLNIPAPPAPVNQIGILGALSQKAPKGPGVRADQLVNQGSVTDSASARNDAAALTVKNPPSGVLGTGSGGARGSAAPGLMSAGTTLKSDGKFDPKSTGPIARMGGKSGIQTATGLSGEGEGLGRKAGLGELAAGDLSVDGGGLDRETVRRVISSSRGQIRTCYEKALVTQPKIEGRIVYFWNISPDGSVSGVEVRRDEPRSTVLADCVRNVIRAMNFPRAENGKPTRVQYPFVFQATH